jgi:hypothetical protein
MIGTILQPTYLPWLGYFEMIAAADVFVVYDHVQFVKKSWHHRNRIKGPNGEILLSIPIKKDPLATPLYQAELAAEYEKVLASHWTSISHAYKKAPYFDKYSESLQVMYLSKYASLTDLTVSFIHYFCNQLGINTKFVNSSTLSLNYLLTNSTEKVVDLCKKTSISSLYDANGAQNFIDTLIFKKNGIDISFQNYEHPVYSQLFGSFLPYMSILDLLLNEGEKSFEIIRNGRRAPIVIE